MQADDVKQTVNTRNAPKKNENENIPVRNIKDLGMKKNEQQQRISVILFLPLDTCFN